MHATDILQKEWIGSTITIENAKNPSHVKIQGIIIDETKHTFVVRTASGDKRINKEGCILRTKLQGKTLRIDSTVLIKRPHERVKQ